MKKNILKAVLIIFTVTLMVLLTRYGWAKYIKKVDGTATAKIASWNFRVSDGTDVTGVTIDLAETRENDTEKVHDKYIAPRN